MSSVSTLRKAGVVARVATHIISDGARRNRTLAAAWSATKATARSFGHVLHTLWLEVIGTLFLAMAGIGGIALVREYGKAHHAPTGRLAVAALFTVTFAWFGVSSFWRVKQKIRRTR